MADNPLLPKKIGESGFQKTGTIPFHAQMFIRVPANDISSDSVTEWERPDSDP